MKIVRIFASCKKHVEQMNRMKKHPLSFLLTLLATLTMSLQLTSCLSDDTTAPTASDRDCLVSNVVLGTLNREMHTLSSAGEDSTYIITVKGSMYPMAIDQVKNEIWNVDSLPVGTDITKVTFAIFNVPGPCLIDKHHEEGDTIFAIADSTDFTRERTITVYSSDAVYSRKYTLQLRVHKEEADSLVWHHEAEKVNALKEAQECHPFFVENTLYIYYRTTDGSTKVIVTDRTDPNLTAPETVQPFGTAAIDVRSVTVHDGRFFAVAEGRPVVSDNGKDGWTDLNADAQAAFIFAAAGDSRYALSADYRRIVASANGTEWKESYVDLPDSLPQKNVAAVLCASRLNENAQSLLLTGLAPMKGKNDETIWASRIWKRDLDNSGIYSTPWMLLPQTTELGDYAFPNLNSPTMISYDHAAHLLGIDGEGNLTPCYSSADNGRTWSPGNLRFPVQSGVRAVSMTVDADQYVWIFCAGSGDVWRGRINRLGWKEEPTEFHSPKRQ